MCTSKKNVAEFKIPSQGASKLFILFAETAELHEFLNLLIEKKSCIFTPISFKIKFGYGLIDFDMIFQMQSSEFTKSLNSGGYVWPGRYDPDLSNETIRIGNFPFIRKLL